MQPDQHERSPRDSEGFESEDYEISVIDKDATLRVLMEIANQSGANIRPAYERLIMGEITMDEFKQVVLDVVPPGSPLRQAAVILLDSL